MEKFSDLKTITKEHLNGQLEKLKVEYEDDKTMRIEVSYTDYDEYHLFYIVEANRETKHLSFVEHYCNYGRDFIRLKPNKPFEQAFTSYLFVTNSDSIQ